MVHIFEAIPEIRDTMNFCARYPDDSLDELRNALAGEARFWIDGIHGDTMLRTAGPERWVHLRQVHDNDAHLADRHRELREQMSKPSRG